ncbi:Uncharacterised protein [Mycobacteroides abscessus]|nr:Uncharacterised protein [Mycobacteroides abscessus]
MHTFSVVQEGQVRQVLRKCLRKQLTVLNVQMANRVMNAQFVKGLHEGLTQM